MKNLRIRFNYFLFILFSVSVAFSTTSCKRTKKATGNRAVTTPSDNSDKPKEEPMGKKEPYVKLDNYFNTIAQAGSLDEANKNIDETLSMFSGPDVPLLIIIHKNGDQKDYDRPTTIKKYLEYLKDTKKNMNAIDNLEFDQDGKIKEITLIKNQ